MPETQKKDFLVTELPKLLKNLKEDGVGNFGLMTPQHMIEHLLVVIKTSAKKYEMQREDPPNKRQMGFQKFVQSGCVLQHRPSDKTKADLPELKYSTLEEAISFMPEAIERFYNFRDDNSNYTPYNPFMGELSFDELELFHYMHVRYHLWQFGLIAQYP